MESSHDSSSQKSSFRPHTSTKNASSNRLMTAMNKIEFSTRSGFTSEGFKDFDSSQAAIRMALAIMLAYLVIGTLVFGLWVEGWTSIDAMYFTVTTFTTVGYGDLYPETQFQRIVGIIFVAGGIMIIGGVVMGVLFDALLANFEESTAERKENISKKFIGKFHSDDGADCDGSNPCMTEVKSKKMEKMLESIVIIGAIFAPALVIGHFEGWTTVESIYYAIITATTVGYGDLSPQLPGTRIAALFYLPLCVSTLAQIFSMITSSFLDRKAEEAEQDFFNRTMNLDDLKRMDIGGDGKVNKDEFLIFMLVAMGKVNEESIEEIMELFDHLDKDDDGCLGVSDIIARAYGDDYVKSQRRKLGRSLRASDFDNV